MTLAIVNLGISNVSSVEHAFDRLGVGWSRADSPQDIESASAVVLPGVGAFPDGMRRLAAKGLVEPLRRHAGTQRKPLLGICLGMQLLADLGEEHEPTQGLGLIPGKVTRLQPQEGARVPNIGWCGVEAAANSRLFSCAKTDPTFYFVHSYQFICESSGHVSATMRFGSTSVVAAVESGQTFGVQFHPEKSQDAGMDLLEAFVKIIGMRIGS
ncbi:MAG: imidazole glycerol phosphate synthase subunit HisH [Alphaproteobacteria bacterium]|nr:imidazole glycerol phosphate synthase subunit HisH [Alphaproteobacteria bacterium]